MCYPFLSHIAKPPPGTTFANYQAKNGPLPFNSLMRCWSLGSPVSQCSQAAHSSGSLRYRRWTKRSNPEEVQSSHTPFLFSSRVKMGGQIRNPPTSIVSPLLSARSGTLTFGERGAVSVFLGLNILSIEIYGEMKRSSVQTQITQGKKSI